MRMDPSRKRRIRLVVALSAAVLLAGALVFTSFNTSSSAVDPSRLMTSAVAGQSYELTGEVVPGSIERRGSEVRFAVKDREGSTSVPIRYSGAVPHPFPDGRAVIDTLRNAAAPPAP